MNKKITFLICFILVSSLVTISAEPFRNSYNNKICYSCSDSNQCYCDNNCLCKDPNYIQKIGGVNKIRNNDSCYRCNETCYCPANCTCKQPFTASEIKQSKGYIKYHNNWFITTFQNTYIIYVINVFINITDPGVELPVDMFPDNTSSTNNTGGSSNVNGTNSTNSTLNDTNSTLNDTNSTLNDTNITSNDTNSINSESSDVNTSQQTDVSSDSGESSGNSNLDNSQQSDSQQSDGSSGSTNDYEGSSSPQAPSDV